MLLSRICIILFILTSLVFGNGSIVTAGSKLLLVIASIPVMVDPSFWKTKWQYWVWCLLFLSFCWLSYLWTYDTATSLRYLPTISFVYICNIALLVLLHYTDYSVFYWFRLFVFASVAMCIYFLYKEGFHYGVDDVRGDTEINLNTIGMLSAFSCSLAVFFYIEEVESRFRIMWMGIILLFIFMILLSASRKALVIPIIIFSIYKVFSGGLSNVPKNVFISLLLVCLCLWMVLSIPILYEMIGYRVEGLINGYLSTDGEVDSSTSTRMMLIEFGMLIFPQEMWLGHGIATFRFLKEAMLGGTAYYAHNNYIELLVDIGLIGTVLYYSFYIFVLFKLYKHIRKTTDRFSIILFAIIVALMISQYGFVAYYNLFVNILLTLIVYYVLIETDYSDDSEEELVEDNDDSVF